MPPSGREARRDGNLGHAGRLVEFKNTPIPRPGRQQTAIAGKAQRGKITTSSHRSPPRSTYCHQLVKAVAPQPEQHSIGIGRHGIQANPTAGCLEPVGLVFFAHEVITGSRSPNLYSSHLRRSRSKRSFHRSESSSRIVQSANTPSPASNVPLPFSSLNLNPSIAESVVGVWTETIPCSQEVIE